MTEVKSTNKEKQPVIEYNGKKYLRIPVKTHVITKDDSIVDVVSMYAREIVKENDMILLLCSTSRTAVPV